ncbi:uncharacterized protein LOC121856453 [Homarus americanus]|uniref:uncharacterized protein LOC121856453 n=1 Tax=Homarus americanus TaxID=6706 RepID=UPI001C45CD5C|nr:uncharacterized protein LOC121856453 [Homarus americanus]
MVVRWLSWVVWVSVVVVGVAGVTADMDRCKDSCSAVPEDLWPYCCETHNTCCQEFADSCVHDCLPRVHTGDVSVVEERPGLCCALYNLCCSRESLRLSSTRNKKQEPTVLPIVHRFQVRPQIDEVKPVTRSGPAPFSQPRRPSVFQPTHTPRREKTSNRPSLFSRPQLPKKPTDSPRVLEQPQFLKNSFSGSEEPNQPVGTIIPTSNVDQRENLEVPKTGGDKDDNLQEKKKTNEDQDRRKSLLETKKPKAGPRLSGLFLARRKGTDESEPTDIEVEARKETTVETVSGLPSTDLSGRRKNTASDTEGTDKPRQGNGRRGQNGSGGRKVTRKRVRVSDTADRQETPRETTDQTQIEVERPAERPSFSNRFQVARERPSQSPVTAGRPGGRLQLSEDILGVQPNFAEDTAFGLPQAGRNRPFGPPQVGGQQFVPPQINVARLFTRQQVPEPGKEGNSQIAEERVGRPQDAQERQARPKLAEESVFDIPHLIEDILFGQSQVTDDTRGEQQFGVGPLFGQPQVNQESRRRFQAVQAQTEPPVPHFQMDENSKVFQPIFFKEDPIGQPVIDLGRAYLPQPTEKKADQPPAPARGAAGRSLITDQVLVIQPHLAVEKISDQSQAAVETVFDQSQVTVEKVFDQSLVTVAVTDETPVAAQITDHPQVAVEKDGEKLQVTAEEVIIQPPVAVEVSDQLPVAVEVSGQSPVAVEISDQSQAPLEKVDDVVIETVNEQPLKAVMDVTDQTDVDKEASAGVPQVTRSRGTNSRSRSRTTGRSSVRDQSQTRETSRSRVASQVTRSRTSGHSQISSSVTDVSQVNPETLRTEELFQRSRATRTRSNTRGPSQVPQESSRTGDRPQATRTRPSRRQLSRERSTTDGS